MDSKVISLQLANRSTGEEVQPRSLGDEYPVKIEFNDVVSPALVLMTHQLSSPFDRACFTSTSFTCGAPSFCDVMLNL